MMRVVAFLQNQWFKDPARVAKMYARDAATPERRATLNSLLLFVSSLTGRRLRDAFTRELCDEIIWEEASPKVAGKSDGVFEPDPQHIAAVIRYFQPGVVLAFGSIARAGLSKAFELLPNKREFVCITGPHPAARHATVRTELAAMAHRLRVTLDEQTAGKGGEARQPFFGANMDTPKCPDCGKPLHRVTQSADSPLNREQFDAAKAGEWFCNTCPGNGRGHLPLRYFWEKELPELQKQKAEDKQWEILRRIKLLTDQLMAKGMTEREVREKLLQMSGEAP